MSRGLRVLEARLLPRGRSDALRQLALLGLAYYGYQLVRGVVGVHVTSAFWNAERVISLERGLHVFVEPAVQAWAAGSSVFIHALAWVYVDAQFVVSVSAIVFIYL